MRGEGISRAAMGRLPEYLRHIRSLPPDEKTVSAAAIARALRLGEVQVRKDLSEVCDAGKPKIGYDTKILARTIERALGARNTCETIIVSANRLDMALLEYGGFAEYGVVIRRAFDIAPEKASAKTLPIGELPAYCALHQVELGVITVPPSAAQQACDLLARSGVRAVWCFAPVRLQAPPGVTVRYENLALSLAHLRQKVTTTMETGELE